MSMSSESSAFPSGALGAGAGAGARRLPSLDLHVADLERQLDEARATIGLVSRENGLLQTRVGELESLVEGAKGELEAARKWEAEQRKRADMVTAREAEAREQFAELKALLYRAEIENARLSGYLDRVSEDDAAREEPRVFQEPRVVPRRPAPMRRGEGGPSVMTAGDNSRRRGHWTGF